MTSAQTVLTRESQCAEGTFTFCSATTESSNQINKPIHQQSIALTADDSSASNQSVVARASVRRDDLPIRLLFKAAETLWWGILVASVLWEFDRNGNAIDFGLFTI